MADSLLPPNATPLEKSLEAATARLGEVPVPVDTLFDPWACPASHLPWLAYHLSVDHWNTAWPETTKRRVTAAAIAVHRRKGTVGAVRRALEALGAPPDPVEWWQMTPEGTPHTFEVTLWVHDRDAATEFGQALFDDAVAVINAAKPERSHFTFRAGAAMDASIGLGAAATGLQRLSASLTPAGGLAGGLVLGVGINAASIHHARVTVS
jgi:phage tail P2-like protein